MKKRDLKTLFDITDNTEIISVDDMVTRVIGENTTSAAVENDAEQLSAEELQAKIEQPDWSKLEGSFTNLNIIGMGGMGTVFSAKDSLFYRNVALKIMRSELRGQEKNINSFIQEARITAQIDHPNIVPVYNLGIFQELGPYFSMKKIDGITLSEVLKNIEMGDDKFEKEYNLRRRMEIFINICNGVAFAHSKGVFHCDLKPSNIMLGDYGEVFIMDWGMAVYRSEKDFSSVHKKIDLGELAKKLPENNKNTINGTPAFMAPEQIFGEIDAIDEQTDVYALGVILYTLLTCTQSPFPQKLPSDEIFQKALSGDFLPPRRRAPKRRISSELQIVCLKAMSPYKDERYKNVKSLMQDIRNILDMHPVEVYNSPFLRFIKYCRRHPMIPTALVGAIITLGVFYSYFSINNILSAVALHQALSTFVTDFEPEYNRLITEFMNDNKKDESAAYFDENNEFDLKNSFIKLDLNCNQMIDTLDNINDVSSNKKYFPLIKKALDFCINYSVITHNSTNIIKIKNISGGLVNKAYLEILQDKPELNKKIALLSRSSGNITFNTESKNISIKIKKMINKENIADKVKNDKKQKTEQTEKKEKREPEYIATFEKSFTKDLLSGEYIIEVTDAAKRTVRIPVYIESGDSLEIDFEFPDVIPENCVYIHKGYYFSNVQHYYSHGTRKYVDGFFLLDRELTIGEYLEYWLTLTDLKLKHRYNPIVLSYSEGNYIIRNLFSADGKILPPYTSEGPLVGISVNGANGFCEYMSRKLNMRCRLPYFYELEKASRGSGRRLFVWGNRFSAEFSLIANNPLASKYPFGAKPKSFPGDISPYNVYDLAGNVRELVMLQNNTDSYAVFGASYRNSVNYAKCGSLSRLSENRTDLGMRYVIEMPVNKITAKKKK